MFRPYSHEWGTNPNLAIIPTTTDLPVLTSSPLGTDQSNDPVRWGHAWNAAVDQFTDATELRWKANTSAHNRNIHFYSPVGISYAQTWVGSFNGINPNYTLLSGHSANLPAAQTNVYGNQWDGALTNFPWWRSGQYHWGIKWNGNRWEVDDYAIGTADTLHQMWIRSQKDIIPPVISSTNFTDESLLPWGNHDIVINYSDPWSGIDTSSASIILQKWDGGSNYWTDISSSDLNINNITTSSSWYSTNNLSFWKYRYIFSINDNEGNSVTTTKIFYIDEPEFTVSDELIDIWEINNTSASFSNTITLTVKTVGAWFNITMNTPLSSLIYTPENIGAWNGSVWFWYDLAPYSTNIAEIGTNEPVATQIKNINTNGNKNIYTYDLKLWAISEVLQAWWDYIWNIDFWIQLDY